MSGNPPNPLRYFYLLLFVLVGVKLISYLPSFGQSEDDSVITWTPFLSVKQAYYSIIGFAVLLAIDCGKKALSFLSFLRTEFLFLVIGLLATIGFTEVEDIKPITGYFAADFPLLVSAISLFVAVPIFAIARRFPSGF